MRGPRRTMVALMAAVILLPVVGVGPPGVPAVASVDDLPNAGRPLTHDELIAVRGEMGDPDQLMTVVADAAVTRRPPPRQAPPRHRPKRAFGWLSRDDGYPDHPSVIAYRAVKSTYPDDFSMLQGPMAFTIAQEITLRGDVHSPAGSYLTPIDATSMARAAELPVGSLIAVRGHLTRLGGAEDCPTPPRELRIGRLGGGSPFIACPAGWITPNEVERPRDGDPTLPGQLGIRVQAGAEEYVSRGFRRVPSGEHTYLLRQAANPVKGAEPTMGWEVIARLDPVEIPAVPVPLADAITPVGLAWHPVLERQPPADLNDANHEPDHFTTTWAGGFAAVYAGRDRVLASWVSEDGRAWRSAALPNGKRGPGDGIRSVHALLPLGDSLVIIADSTEGTGGSRWGFDVWRSEDGLTWEQLVREILPTPARYASEEYSRVVKGYRSTGNTIVAYETFTRGTGSGGRAPGWTVVSDERPPTYAWVTSDGFDWERHRVRGLSRGASILEHNGELWALSSTAGANIDHSTDGVTWKTVGHGPPDLERFYYWPRFFQATRSGYLIGGQVEEPRDPEESWEEDVVIWHSPDLAEWTETIRPPDGEIVSMAAVEEDVVVIGGARWDSSDHPGGWWQIASRDGGRTWDDELAWATERDWCPRSLTPGEGSLLLQLGCAPLEAASMYLLEATR